VICPRTILVLLVIALCECRAAEPDWPIVEQHALDLLQRYVRIASVNPPADTTQAAIFLKSELERVSLKPKLYESGPNHVNLLVRLRGRSSDKKPLLLLNHMDTVPVDPARWKDDPFSASIRDGSLWGRGSLDMKSTAIMQLTSLMLLKQLGITPPRDIVFLATCDEETDAVYGAGWMIEHHWDELNPEYVMDEGGIGSTDLFAPGKTVFGVSVDDKQVLWLKVRAEGTSAHASQPIQDNANDIPLRALEKARNLAVMQRELGEFANNKFMNAIQQNTISLTTLQSGVGNPPKVNVIPSVAEATLDCRLLPGVNAEEFLSEIRARVNDSRVSFTKLSHPVDASPSSSRTALYEAIEHAIKRTHPNSVVAPIILPYGTDTQKFRKKGVAGYGIMLMILDSATLATMHSDSEHVPVDQFKQGLHIYFDILRSDY
jgi:acetylornithine deacetylase/succinyl-diaminopimelate desuccinylase-like protein